MNIYERAKEIIQSLIRSITREHDKNRLKPEMSITSLPGPFAAAYALGKYSLGPNHKKTDLGELIHNVKYHYSQEAADILADFIISSLPHLPTKLLPDLILTIPDSIINRPFSPVSYISKQVGAHFHWKVIDDAITPIRFERPQKDRNINEKLSDYRYRFRLTHPELLKDKNILLFDDIFDSGCTLKDAGHLLWTANPTGVSALTLVKLG